MLNSFGQKIRFIFMGDLNAHHTAWDCEYVNWEGRSLLEILDDLGAVILNDGTPTLIQLPNYRRSVIDLCILSSNLALICSSITLDESGRYSDNLLVKMQLGRSHQSRFRFCYKINLNKQESEHHFMQHCSPSQCSHSSSFYSLGPNQRRLMRI